MTTGGFHRSPGRSAGASLLPGDLERRAAGGLRPCAGAAEGGGGGEEEVGELETWRKTMGV